MKVACKGHHRQGGTQKRKPRNKRQLHAYNSEGVTRSKEREEANGIGGGIGVRGGNGDGNGVGGGNGDGRGR